MPLLAQNAFRMELNAMQRQGFVHDAHNVVTTTIPFCPCSNLETIGQRLWRDHQRMVARHGQRIIQPGKDTPAGMADGDVLP